MIMIRTVKKRLRFLRRNLFCFSISLAFLMPALLDSVSLTVRDLEEEPDEDLSDVPEEYPEDDLDEVLAAVPDEDLEEAPVADPDEDLEEDPDEVLDKLPVDDLDTALEEAPEEERADDFPSEFLREFDLTSDSYILL